MIQLPVDWKKYVQLRAPMYPVSELAFVGFLVSAFANDDNQVWAYAEEFKAPHFNGSPEEAFYKLVSDNLSNFYSEVEQEAERTDKLISEGGYTEQGKSFRGLESFPETPIPSTEDITNGNWRVLELEGLKLLSENRS